MAASAIVRIRDGKAEHLVCGNTYDVVNSVMGGPCAIGEYLDGSERWAGKRVINQRTSINSAEGEGLLLIDYDNKVVIFFGGDIESSCRQQKAVMNEIASASHWDGWDVRWAYKGLLDAARYLDQVPELLNQPFFGRVEMEYPFLFNAAVTADECLASSIIAVKADGRIRLYPLDDVSPEDLFHFGEPKLVSMLDAQGCCNDLRFESCDLVRGFLFDEDLLTVTYWGLCCELLPERLEEAWPGWKAIDLEGNRREFERIISSFMAFD